MFVNMLCCKILNTGVFFCLLQKYVILQLLQDKNYAIFCFTPLFSALVTYSLVTGITFAKKTTAGKGD